MDPRIARLERGLIVSCQPVPGGPMDQPAFVVGFALAALSAGAVGLRIEGLGNLRAVRAATDAPIIGLIKRDLSDTPVRITPYADDAVALARAGADIVAFDATLSSRPEEVGELIAAIHRQGCAALADVSTAEEGRAAAALGAGMIASTLSGYTEASPPRETPDLELVSALAAIGRPVIAEGHIRTPADASAVRRAGAYAVCVGSAITRPEHITSWFVAALNA
jgi:N-acetylmannosamine-6-phosphate 2-epimerase/N-acetylmannosamine kinase